ncbi:protein kinase domain-containing protein [Larkinella sp. VNQ87]|uniref:protein kinase domain-containing protein n=1 Tax=Larkinella sp. VNQ87 TaxID=3400921 RepID=UPI003BFCE370
MTYEDFRQRYQYDPGKLSFPEHDEDFGRLGEGGFGAVYKGWDVVENQWVAVKVSPVRSEQRDLSLQREVELANQLPRHTNIARYEFCERFTTVYGVVDMAVLKYYREGSLADLLRSKSLTQAEKDDLISGILSGLAHLHRHHMAHRDLKPQNILITRTPYGKYVPLITDFGLSKVVRGEDMAATATAFLNSTVGGSVYYMAPEQLANSRMRFNVDLWAFGVILYELMTGQKPFIGDSGAGSETERSQIIQRINQVEIPSQFNQIPEPYQAMIRQCLVRDVDQRVHSADTLLLMLATQTEPGLAAPVEVSNEIPTPVERPFYDEQRSFREGYAAVRRGPRWGLVNTAGNLVVPVEYDSVTDVQERQALVRKQGQASRIVLNGNSYQLLSPIPERPEPQPVPPPPVPLPGPAPLRKDAILPTPDFIATAPTALRQVYIIVAVGFGLALFSFLLMRLVSEGAFLPDDHYNYNYYDYEHRRTSNNVELLALLMLGTGFLLVAGVWVTALWKVFEKAGEPGWAAIVPVYNALTLLKIVGKPWWWLLLMLAPYVNFIFMFWVLNLLSKRFGKSGSFTVGLLFLPFIFYPQLAWGETHFQRASQPAAV